MTAAPDRAPVEECIFCRIVTGEQPAHVVRSTDAVLAFREIAPVGPTHVLVVPKAHVTDASVLGSADGPLLAEMLEVARLVAEDDGVADGGYRLVFNVGDDAGNSVPHLHLHVIGGRQMAWPPG